MSLQFKFPDTIPTTVSVVKLSVGDKFYIAKTTSLEWLRSELQSVYGKYLRGGIAETNLYYSLVRYIHKQEMPKIIMEVLYTSDNGYQVLKYELEQLSEHFGTRNCLNQNNTPHIPKTVAAKKGSQWLKQNESLNFRKLLTKYDY